jgi:hypothetical protein
MSDERRAATQEIPGPALQGGAAGERTLGTQGALLLVLGTALLASVPLLVVDVPPMLDYPNRLARDFPTEVGRARVQSEISDFGSEMQDSSNFEMSSPMDVSSN